MNARASSVNLELYERALVEETAARDRLLAVVAAAERSNDPRDKRSIATWKERAALHERAAVALRAILTARA
jgi:hypothetical protein